MGVSCQKQVTLNVKAAGPCVAPTLKSWTNAAVTGKSFNLGANGNVPLQGMLLQSAASKLWVYPAANESNWFFDTYDITAATPVAPVPINANPDGAFPIPQGFIYVPASNKIVVWRQRWNGAAYELWLTFVNATTGVENSHIAGLSTETHRAQFCAVERTGLTDHYVGFLNGNAGIHMKVYLIDVDTETIINTRDIGATLAGSITYSCVTDSFFVSQGANLLELDRATLNTNHTYVGNAANSGLIDYVKSTQEIWGATNSNGTVDITNAKTGAYSTMALTENFSGWSGGFPVPSRFYHETLNAFCIPGATTGFSGNPTFYYLYDVASRTLKKQLDISNQVQLFAFSDWWAQAFNLTAGSIYVSTGAWNTPPNYGVFEIGTS